LIAQTSKLTTEEHGGFHRGPQRKSKLEHYEDTGRHLYQFIGSFQASSAEISRSKLGSWSGLQRITRRSQSGSANSCSSPRTIAYLGSSAIRVNSRVWSFT